MKHNAIRINFIFPSYPPSNDDSGDSKKKNVRENFVSAMKQSKVFSVDDSFREIKRKLLNGLCCRKTTKVFGFFFSGIGIVGKWEKLIVDGEKVFSFKWATKQQTENCH